MLHSLKAKGLDISATGVAMRSNKKFDRQDYLDATQRYVLCMSSFTVAHPALSIHVHLRPLRIAMKHTNRGIINVMEASSFRKNVSPDGSSPHPPTAVLERSSSHMSTNSTSSIEKKKKKGLFSSKKRVDS